MTIAAIILAAGESTRMGRPKPLLPWDGETLVAWQVRQMVAAGVDDVVVVLGHEAEAARSAVPPPARVVLNEAYREGRASSLRAGAKALAAETSAVLVVGVDQPRPAWVTRAVAGEWWRGGAKAIVPAHGGRRGHPVLVDGSLLAEVGRASEEEMGLRGVLERHLAETRVVEIGNEVVNLDLNTPEEYQAALQAFRAGAWKECLDSA